MSEQTIIPDKLYFRIGEVSKLIGVEPYVLRYWETEFPEIAPVKSKAKQRLYKRQDVELIYQIKELLYHQNFTIKGAKKKIKDLKRKTATGDLDGKIQIELGLESGQQSSSQSLGQKSQKIIESIISEMDEFTES